MPPTTTTTHALKEKKRLCKEQSLVDFALYGGALSTNLDDMPKLVEAGVVGFKTGLCDIVKSIFPRLNDAEILEVFKRVREIGSGVGVHAENDEIITYLTEKLQKSGRVDPLAHGESRPVIAELEATSRAILLAAEAGNRLHIFHMSIASGADLVQRAKAGGQAVTAETCPHYLVLNEDHVKELKAYGKMNPPIRSKEEVEKLWKALREGKIDNIASDHAPWPKEEKDKGDENIWNAPGGFPGIQSMLTLMLNEGVNKGRITLESLVALVCENPARIWKIYPQKGAIPVHNPSSNLRLHSGISPVVSMTRAGVRVALGTDSTGLNDDDDMIQEMRLCWLIHRLPGVTSAYLESTRVFDMATTAGAKAAGFERQVGAIEVRRKADLVLLDGRRILSPLMSSRIPLSDVILQRAKASDIDTVIIDGKVALREGRFPEFNEDSTLKRLTKSIVEPDTGRVRDIDAIKKSLRELYGKWDNERGYVYNPTYSD